MAEKWEMFEKDCFKYLCNRYTGRFSFVAHGESNAAIADVEVDFIDKTNYFIAIKEDKAQCCQFVLFPNKDLKKFEVSEGVKSPTTKNRENIIDYMDKRFETFSKVGSKGIPIDIEKSILYGWVNDFYTAKNVNFFMTKGDEYIIFPIDRVSYYFDISAFYRKKPSGSSEPNKNNNSAELQTGIINNSLCGYIEYAFIGGKNRCFFHTDASIHKKRIVCPNYTYQFKDNGHSKKIPLKMEYVYEVRRLSNTNNPNVICQLFLKEKQQILNDLSTFEKTLNSKE